MNNRPSTPIYVGIFSMLATLLLMFISLRAHESEVVTNPRTVIADFERANGLTSGSEVRFLGVRVGLVKSVQVVERDGTMMARVTMDVSSAVDIRQDSRAVIESATLLGSQVVAFYGGSVSSPAADESSPLLGETQEGIADVAAKVGEGVETLQKLAEGLDKNQGTMFAKIEAVIDENRDNIKKATESLAEVGPKLDEMTTKMSAMVNDAAEGKGTIGKLLADSEMYDQLNTISKDVNKITSQIAAGEGTMGKLVFTDEGLNDIKASFEELKLAANDIRDVVEENREPLKKTMEGMQNVGPAIESITKKIETGEGTLGKFVNDPGLYDEAKSAFTQIQQTFEEAEEQTVLQSFLRVFGGAI